MATTLIKIPKAERDIIERKLMDCRYSPVFYTIENNDGLLLCEIDSDDPAILWHLGKMCGQAIIHKSWSDDVEKLRRSL